MTTGSAQLSTGVTTAAPVVAGGHAATPQSGDHHALQSACTVCAERILWRLGTGEWEHTP